MFPGLVDLAFSDVNISQSWNSLTRPCLIALTTIICTAGIFGNSIVLYGSVKHNALKLDTVSRFLIQTLAVWDLLAVTLVYSTMLVTLITHSWVLGSVLCFVTGRAGYLIVMNQVWVILALSLYRAWRLKQPKGRRLDVKVMYLMEGTFGVLSVVLTLISMMARPVVYLPSQLTCLTGDLYTKNGRYLAICLQFIPLIIILFLNKYIQVTVYRTNRRNKKSVYNVRKPLLMLTVMTYIQLLSLVPINSFVIMQSLDYVHSVKSTLDKIINWFPLFSMYIVSLNSCSNFFIYFWTNKRFKVFTTNLITCQRNRTDVASVADTADMDLATRT
ncbi:hypothetical protein ACHWQZ_G010708 [Mnemiopsis leidyi]